MARHGSVGPSGTWCSGARIRWMPSRRTTTSTRCTYSAGVVGINTSAFLEAAAVGKPVHTVLLPEVSRDNQEGTLHFRYLLTRQRRPAARRALARRAPARCWPSSLAPGGRRRREGQPVRRRVRAALRPRRGRHAAIRRRRRGSRHAAGSACASAAPLGAWLAFLRNVSARVRAGAAPALAAVAQADPAQAGQAVAEQRTLALRRIKQFAIDHLGAAGKQRKSATTVGGSALTPKTGRQRDPAKTLAGTDVREARHARELVTVLGRSDRPIIVGPWLSETGFELLYWIPFVAWAKAYGNFDPVTPGGGVARRRGPVVPPHHRRTTRRSSRSSRPTSSGSGTSSRIEEQEGRLKHLEISSFDREIIARVERKLGLTGAEVLHPSLMYQLFDHYWYQRDAGDAGRGVHVVRAADGADRCRHPAAPARPLRGRQVLRQRGPAVDTRERPFRRVVPRRSGAEQRRGAAEHRAAVRRPLGLPQGAAGPGARDRPPDGSGAQPGGADRGDPQRRRRSSAPTGASRIWRRSAASTRWRSTRTRTVSASITWRWPSACSRRCSAAPSPNWTSGPWTRCGSDSPARCRCRQAARGEQSSRRRRPTWRPSRRAARHRGAGGRSSCRSKASRTAGMPLRRRAESARDACVNAGQGRVPAACGGRCGPRRAIDRRCGNSSSSTAPSGRSSTSSRRWSRAGAGWWSAPGSPRWDSRRCTGCRSSTGCKTRVSRRSGSRRGRVARRRRRLVRGRGGPVRRDLGSHRPGRVRPPQRRSAAPPSTIEASDLDREILDARGAADGQPRFRRDPPGPDVPPVHARTGRDSGPWASWTRTRGSPGCRRRSSSIRRCCRANTSR